MLSGRNDIQAINNFFRLSPHCKKIKTATLGTSRSRLKPVVMSIRNKKHQCIDAKNGQCWYTQVDLKQLKGEIVNKRAKLLDRFHRNIRIKKSRISSKQTAKNNLQTAVEEMHQESNL